MGSVTRDELSAAVRRWEKKAKDEMYLDAFLHQRARDWLLDELMGACESAKPLIDHGNHQMSASTASSAGKKKGKSDG